MNTKKTLFWVSFFSIGMGFLESAVVIYLRKLYYVNGFAFPLAPMQADVAIVEVWREAATMIMLVAIGVLAGKNRAEKFAWFIFSFAVWDIFYYVFLYVFLGWPQSLMAWDILFLIPVPWVGPVITPGIIAITMIAFALSIIYFLGAGKNTGLKWPEQMLLVAGSLVAIISFTRDFITQTGNNLYRNLQQHGSLVADLSGYIPVHFDWWIFWIGEGLLLSAWLRYISRMKRLV